MPLIVPLPQSIGAHRQSCTHPGLLLDKFVESYDSAGNITAKWQEAIQLPTIRDVAGLHPPMSDELDFSRLLKRWTNALVASAATLLRCTTTGPLTLHLSRASALENAGICLHPLYGFVYLPGSGLKGMARAFAETVWLPNQLGEDWSTAADKLWDLALDRIDEVFGYGPHIPPKPDARKLMSAFAQRLEDQKARRDRSRRDGGGQRAHVGSIVFHDAWPEAWPKLIVDIVNNHHTDYYQHDGNHHPPGDWENPVPVYFLAAVPGVTFTFPLAKRRTDVADELRALAGEWLLGALCHLGAGAKTNAGYGAFRPTNDVPPSTVSAVAATWKQAIEPSKHRAEFSTTLELVTPAFLAGASQQAEDCDLRPATLRGHLRWWWRTMHAGFLDVQTLRTLEAAIWGDTKSGGAVRIIVEKRAGGHAVPYDKRRKASFNDQQKVSDLGIPNGDARKATQGLWYASYGMDESNQRRFVLEPPASWYVRVIARPARFSTRGVLITAQQGLQQAYSALWLLIRFGGVGSKAGKGFGSLSTNDMPDEHLDSIRQSAADLRQSLNLGYQFTVSAAGSASLQQMFEAVEVKFTWPTLWSILDQVGFAWQTLAKKYKHKREKMALGLPRRIGSPAQGNFRPTPPVTTNGRHTSPVRIHIEQIDNAWLVRAVAFPAAHLPDLQTSCAFLNEFLKDFGDDLRRRAGLNPPLSRPLRGSFGGRGTEHLRPSQPQLLSAPSRPQPGERVEAKLLAEKTKKGGWKAKHEPTGLSGPIQNTGDVPGDKTPGDTLTLIVASANEREIAFRYPMAVDELRSKKVKGGK